MSHYYHIGTSRVVTTPHGGRTTTVIHVGEKRQEIGREEREKVKEKEREGRLRGAEGEDTEEEKSSSILVTNRFDTFLPPFVSNVAYTRWTAARGSRKRLPLATSDREERRTGMSFVCHFN